MEPDEADGHSLVQMGSWLEDTAETIAGNILSTDDKEATVYFQIRGSLINIYPVFIVLNVIVFVLAVPANIVIIIKILRTTEIRNSRVLRFMINAALCDIFKSVFVQPITLANLLLQNFVFGAFLCYALPMLQVFPIHTSIINYAGLVYDRYRGIRYPDKKRCPVALYTSFSWILAFCSVLPYAGVIRYYDLEETLGPNLGFCMMTLDKHIENYLRVSFFLLFLIPSMIMVILFIRTASELGFQRKAASSCLCDSQCMMWEEWESRNLTNPDNIMPVNGTHFSSRSNSTINTKRSSVQTDGTASRLTNEDVMLQSGTNENLDNLSVNDVECPFCISELQRNEQSRIILIVSLFIGSWAPTTLYSFVTYFVPQRRNDDDLTMTQLGHQVSDSADVMTLILTLIGFISTIWNPFIIYSMIIQRVRIHQTCNDCFSNNLVNGSRQAPTPESHYARKISQPKGRGSVIIAQRKSHFIK